MDRRRFLLVAGALAPAVLVAGCGGSGSTEGASASGSAVGTVTLDFSQWWEVELNQGVMRSLMDQFQNENPGIKVNLISNPYAATMDLEIAGAATKTLPDVVAINGTTVYDLYDQGALANLSTLMKAASFDASQLATDDKIDGSTYIVRALNFTYPMYFNTDLLKAAGVTGLPTTRTEFAAMAKAVTNPTKNIYAWSLPINVQSPAGFVSQSWLWSGGSRFLDSGKPAFNSDPVKSWLEFLQSQYKAGYVAPGAFTQQEQAMVEEFTAGRNAAMIGSLAHINGIRKSNPKLNFTIAPVPVVDGYTGKHGIAGASWGLGIAENSKHKTEAWKLIQWIMSTDVNSKLSTEAIGFPGNKKSVPGYVQGDELFTKAFDMYQQSEMVTELDGKPKALDLLRNLNENLVKLLDDKADVAQTQQSLQQYWSTVLK
jgi:multiple sugar transport system substrate-binding protein